MSGAVRLEPLDVHNERLLANVHPQDWANPRPADRYNLVVIGAGTAGLVTAVGAAGLGARVAIVDRYLFGGDCLNYGCVPSKALIRAARAAAEVRAAGEMGVRPGGAPAVDFPAVMERMRRLRAEISRGDSVHRLRRLGIDVFLGEARFVDGGTIEVGGDRLRFAKAAIATGARAAVPPIPGLAEAGFLTNETLFTLTELPARMAFLGAGPIGCEMAQTFARFGATAELMDMAPRVLAREDAEAASVVARALTRDGVRLRLGVKVKGVAREGGDRTIALETPGGEEIRVPVDAILVGAGRAPNVQGLNLEAAGVAYDERRGVQVDDGLKTTNPNIYAAGDVASAFKFTHVADRLARIVIRNALFPGRARASALVIPWCTYTSPEVAHVGLNEAEAAARDPRARTFTTPLEEVDRAILDGETGGFVKVHVAGRRDRILGGTVVAAHAGEMISEITLAMVGGLGLRAIGRTIHPYPTQADALRKTADAMERARLRPWATGLLRRWMGWRR